MSSARVLIFSDCHLGAPGSVSIEGFERFCREQAAGRPRVVYCLGDLFHYWVGRGQERLAEARRAFGALSTFSDAGAKVVLFHGNRDFLLDRSAIASVCGAEVVAHALEVEHFGVRFRLEHGDSLLARDTRYLAMRRVIRARGARALFAALPFAWRWQVALGMRAMSEREVKRKRVRSFALSRSLVRARLRRAHVLVLGHVHRAARRRLAGARGLVFTLGAWEGDERSWIEVDAEALRLHAGSGGKEVVATPLAALGG